MAGQSSQTPSSLRRRKCYTTRAVGFALKRFAYSINDIAVQNIDGASTPIVAIVRFAAVYPIR